MAGSWDNRRAGRAASTEDPTDARQGTGPTSWLTVLVVSLTLAVILVVGSALFYGGLHSPTETSPPLRPTASTPPTPPATPSAPPVVNPPTQASPPRPADPPAPPVTPPRPE